ncbi:MAG: type II toxin-antitoxin system RelE/ParE family toxin [Crocinitomicaceae bacterium]|jgi:hypothetical protein
MKYNLFLDPRAIDDIQSAIDYYNDQSNGLGEKFEKHLNTYILSISKNPFFQVRYDNVHCLPMKKYPFMIHFTIENESIYIHAVLHTKLNPKKNWIK